MKQIKVWETIDGKLFKDKSEAETHEEKNRANHERKVLFESKRQRIKEYIAKEDEIPVEDVSIVSQGGEWGWDCDDKNNPIDKCIYASIKEEYYDECCVFCHHPQERK